jgi:hypothetical protein
MPTIDTLRAHYQARAHDPTLTYTDRTVAEAQLASLTRRPLIVTATAGGPRTSRWAHVNLAELVEESGNVLRERRNGTITTSHEPIHDSKSGTCPVIWPGVGRWWCSNCRQSGDAVTWVMQTRGCDAREAAAELVRRFGPPSVPAGYLRRRRRTLPRRTHLRDLAVADDADDAVGQLPPKGTPQCP